METERPAYGQIKRAIGNSFEKSFGNMKESLSEIRQRLGIKKNRGITLKSLFSLASAVGTVGALAISRHFKSKPHKAPSKNRKSIK